MTSAPAPTASMPAVPAPARAPVVELGNISKTYYTAAGEVDALRGVTLNVEQGEFLSIMGPSGSGKSTLMNIIGLLDRPTDGTYRIAGNDIGDCDEVQLAGLRAHTIGFVFQSFNLLPRATVLKNVILPLEYTNTPRSRRHAKAESALRRAGLDQGLYHHKSNELSGGQMQRVAIARALVNNPSILLADEPTGNLDTKTGEAVLETLKDLHAQGTTIILITHESSIARQAQRTVYIKDGELLEGDRT